MTRQEAKEICARYGYLTGLTDVFEALGLLKFEEEVDCRTVYIGNQIVPIYTIIGVLEELDYKIVRNKD